MDTEITQQLTQLVQQMLQVLQAAGGAPQGQEPPDAQDGTMDKGGMMPQQGMQQKPAMKPMMKMDDSDAQGMQPGMQPDMGDGDMDDGGDMGDDEMGGDGGSLHDRVSQLESHTGLKKSAGAPLVVRLDQLEQAYFGEEYEGPVVLRVQQLEKAAGVRHQRKAAPPAAQPAAPETIDLGDLIKAAIAPVMTKLNALEQQVNNVTELPTAGFMRKTATTVPRTNGRKAQAHAVGTDADLVKTAQVWGLDGSDLDAPLSFGDSLQAMYNSQRNGGTLGLDPEDDN